MTAGLTNRCCHLDNQPGLMEETLVLFFHSVPDHPRGLVPGMYADGGLRGILQLRCRA